MPSIRFPTLTLCLLTASLGGCSSSSGGSELAAKVFALANGCVLISTSAGTRFIAPSESGDAFEASAFADALIEGGSAVVAQLLDINEDLSRDSNVNCNALSATFDMRGAP